MSPLIVPDILLPIIHNSGSRRKGVLARLEHAYTAVRQAMSALRACAPNGRNASPAPGLMQQLEAQHRPQQAPLHAVYKSLEAEALPIEAEASGRR